MDASERAGFGAGLLLAEPLNTREIEILRLVADGHTNQQIANDLHLALTTVKWYNTQIFGKLGVNNRRQAVNQARQQGLLHGEGENVGLARTALPRLTAPFVGRQDELDALTQLVQDRTPMITLLGAGGMGKTTLALYTAHRMRTQFRDGVYFVPLAPVRSPIQIVTAIAECLHFQFRSDAEPLQEQLFVYLAEQETLLVLDNFEHLLDSAVLLSDLVQAAPDVTLIVTSRERLNLAVETVFAVGGLGCPPADTILDTAYQHAAIQLFVQRARRSYPDFELVRDYVPYIVQVCRLVGGMPLAIELAAGWIGVLTADQIAAELKQSMDILETDMRDVPNRQRSVRATLDYSWARLTEVERAAFTKLSVLEAGFDADAAAAVAGADARVLRKLIHRSLVDILPAGQHSMHELLRQYGMEKLRDAGQFDATRDRHARYYADLAATLYQGPYSLRRQPTRAVLERNLDNVLVAWRHITRARLDDLVHAVVECLTDYIHSSARYFEGQEWLSEGLETLRNASPDDPVAPSVLGWVLAHLGNVYVSTDTEQALILVTEAIQLLEPLGPSRALLRAYNSYADHVCFRVEDESVRTAAMRTACDVATALGESLYLAETLSLGAMTAHTHGDLERARHLAQEAHRLAEGHHNAPILIAAKGVLAGVCCDQDDYDTALHYLQEMLLLTAGSDHVFTISGVHTNIADVYLRRNQLGLARQHMREAIHVHLLYADDWQTVGSVFSVARHWHMAIGQLERAVELLAFSCYHPLATSHRAPAQVLLEQLEAQIDPQVFATAVARGRASDLADVVDALLAELSGED